MEQYRADLTLTETEKVSSSAEQTKATKISRSMSRESITITKCQSGAK